MRKLRDKHPIWFCIVTEIICLLALLLFGILLGQFFPRANYYLLLSVQEILGIGVVLLIAKLSGATDFLTRKKGSFAHGLVTGGYFIVVGLYTLIVMLITQIRQGGKIASFGTIVAFFLCMAAVGIVEEFLFRGIISTTLLKTFGTDKKGICKAMLLSGLLFGAAHMVNSIQSSWQGVIVQMTVAAAMGVLLTVIYYRTANIWLVAFLHAFIDVCASAGSGLFANEGTLVDLVSGYQWIQLIGVIPYVLTVIVLLRNTKIGTVAQNFPEFALRNREQLPADDTPSQGAGEE